MAGRRRSEIIKPLVAPSFQQGHHRHHHRRSNSWTLSDCEYYSDNDDDMSSLAEQLTNQRWHEVGNGPYPICASEDFDTMVDQLSSILAMRLRDLLIYWVRGAGPQKKISPSSSFASKKDALASAMEFLTLDTEIGDYVLVDSIVKSIKEYVTCVGNLYNHVGFHSFEHATHVTVSMNKLLSMVTISSNLRAHMKRRTSEQNVASHVQQQNSHNFSFGIGEDPRILFAMVFSALIHDVGHTGVPNSVLVDEEDDLAILHNDVSVAEQNSLQVAFSMLQQDNFAQLKKCICPTPEERKFFRKKVISMVMVTDISDQERIQIVKSRWNAAFPEERKEESDGSSTSANGQKQRGDSISSDEEDKDCRPKRHTVPGATVSQKDQHSPKRRMVPVAPVKPRNRKNVNEIQSQEIRESLERRRFTMFTTDAAAEEFANTHRYRRLGIRTSMDFSGMLLDAYRTMDQLQQHAVLETIMNVADVAHTMQSFTVFLKWNRRLFKEFYVAHQSDRLSFNPSENWYGNQIGFFQHYIIPLSQKMKLCGVFGTTGSVFEYFATENKKRWIEEGEALSEEIISDVMEEVEKERELQNGCH